MGCQHGLIDWPPWWLKFGCFVGIHYQRVWAFDLSIVELALPSVCSLFVKGLLISCIIVSAEYTRLALLESIESDPQPHVLWAQDSWQLKFADTTQQRYLMMYKMQLHARVGMMHPRNILQGTTSMTLKLPMTAPLGILLGFFNAFGRHWGVETWQ